MVMNSRRKSEDNYVDSPVAWFVVLERARLNRDLDLAAKARRELEHLGVTVKYRSLGALGKQRGNND